MMKESFTKKYSSPYFATAMKIEIRNATVKDAEQLAALGRKSFYEKWKGTTSADNMQRYLEETFLPEKIAEEIADPSVIYLLAEENGTAVGYSKLLHTHPDIEVAEDDV